MKTRGEEYYIYIPLFAAKLYDNLTSVRGVNKTFEEIASFITISLKYGKLLDIGTGPGRLLYEVNKKNPQIDLYGLDISLSMIHLANQNLRNIKNINLKAGNIAKTDLRENFFDCIVATGSFYNWDKPVKGLDEIFRILKPGKKAYIFESNKNYNKGLFNSRLKDNLKEYNFIRRIISKFFLKKQLKMTYSITEIKNLIKQSKFENHYNIQEIELGNLPIWIKIELKKT